MIYFDHLKSCQEQQMPKCVSTFFCENFMKNIRNKMSSDELYKLQNICNIRMLKQTTSRPLIYQIYDKFNENLTVYKQTGNSNLLHFGFLISMSTIN